MTSPCPVCRNPGTRPHLHLRGRAIRECLRCAVRWADPLPTAGEVEARERRAFTDGLLPETRGMFSRHGKDFREDPLVRGYRACLARLAAGTRGRAILDVGVATGLFLHLAREAGWTPNGVDLAPEAAGAARKEFDIPVAVADFHTFTPQAAFDAITMWDVLEHAREPDLFVRRAFDLLAPGGILFVALPDCANLLFRLVDTGHRARLPFFTGVAEKLYVPNHLFYFRRETLARLLTDAGFSVLATGGSAPFLGRYALSAPARLTLAGIFAASRLLGHPGRIEIYAKKPAG